MKNCDAYTLPSDGVEDSSLPIQSGMHAAYHLPPPWILWCSVVETEYAWYGLVRATNVRTKGSIFLVQVAAHIAH